MPARTLVESIAFINAEQSAFLKEHGDPKFCGSLGAFGFRYRSSSSSPLSFRMISGSSPVSTGAWSACLGSIPLHSGFLLFLGIIQVIFVYCVLRLLCTIQVLVFLIVCLQNPDCCSASTQPEATWEVQSCSKPRYLLNQYTLF